MKDSNLLFPIFLIRSTSFSISAPLTCCLFPVTLLAYCLHVHDVKDSNLLFISTVSPPAISLARSASSPLIPIGRLHSFLKNPTSPACFTKKPPRINAALNFSRLSPPSNPGRFCWMHLSSSLSSHFLSPRVWALCG